MGDRVGVELLYNAVKTEVEAVEAVEFRLEGSRQLETKCGRESHIRPKGPLGPDELRSREDADNLQ